MNFGKKDNLLEYFEYYLIKDNNVYKIEIGNNLNNIIIKSENYKTQLDSQCLSLLLGIKFNSISELYLFINNIFENNQAFIKEIKYNITMKLLLSFKIKNQEKKKEIILYYNQEDKEKKDNQEIIQEIINNYNKQNKYISILKEEIKILKQEIKKLKLNNNSNKKICKISKEVNFNMKSSIIENIPLYIQHSKKHYLFSMVASTFLPFVCIL